MTLSDLQTLIGSLTNDPSHDRYSTTDIGTELDNTMDDWNVKAKIIKDTYAVTWVDGTRQYALSDLTGTPISFPRATHKGLEMKKVSKTWLDLYTGSDWTVTTGTPKYFFIEATDPDVQKLTVYPTPTGEDAGAYGSIEYIKRHTAMSASTDTPFMSGTTVNYLLRPYDWGIAYATAARLLVRDPSSENVAKITTYSQIASNVLSDVIQVFKSLEAEEPKRIAGGRYAGGNVRFEK